MRRKRYKPNTDIKSGFFLNINSMTDMFTILLVFLFQTYSTAEIQVTPDKDMVLPLSSSEANPIMSVQISVSKNELKVEDKIITSLNNLDFTSKDVDPNDSNFIKPLFNELEVIAKLEKEKEEKYKSGESTEKPNIGILEGRILMKADSALSYGTLRKVMYTASMAGFPKLKLATVIGQ